MPASLGFMEYSPRVVDSLVEDRLAAVGALLLRGPKGSGKTATGRRHTRSEIEIDDSPRVRIALDADPRVLLAGDAPRLIDEWQVQPSLWNTVRHEVDRRQAKGQFILTGSSTPRDEDLPYRHSGTGRFAILDMRTMSWRERSWSTGEILLESLFEGLDLPAADSDPGVDEIARRLAIGGWPGTLHLGDQAALQANADYYDLLAKADAPRAWGGSRDALKVARALRSIARNVSTECSQATIAKDAGGADGRLADETVAEYLRTFRDLMVEEDLPAWNTHIRSSATLRRQPKRHLCDTSLCCQALGVGPEQLLADFEYFGLLFESQAIHDLRVYGAACGASVYHYRDSNGVEADAVLERRDGSWAAFEIKLGFGAVDAAAESLLRFAANIDQARVGSPRALVVITGSGFAHRRKDGVLVVPLGCLG
ncbi:MAG: DUF4143 domain-containing protein [Propionibacteriaceae bacterium]|nr:DUF4143 domain-containing protein [Propionibacteriaceae bacterium]